MMCSAADLADRFPPSRLAAPPFLPRTGAAGPHRTPCAESTNRVRNLPSVYGAFNPGRRFRNRRGAALECKRLPQLLDDPPIPPMTADVAVQDAPTIVADHARSSRESRKGSWRNGEEVQRRHDFPDDCEGKLSQRLAAAAGISGCAPLHPACDRSLEREQNRASEARHGCQGLPLNRWGSRQPSGRSSRAVGILPTRALALEISRPYQRNPARCQRTTVSGVTMSRECFQPDQTHRATTQKILAKMPRRGRRC